MRKNKDYKYVLKFQEREENRIIQEDLVLKFNFKSLNIEFDGSQKKIVY